jgi:hypothetical protein
MKYKNIFVKLNLADFIDYPEYTYNHSLDDFDNDFDDDFDNDFDDSKINNIGIIKYKKKFLVKKGASSQNYFDAEAQDFQYKNKKQIEYEEFEKEYQKQLNIIHNHHEDEVFDDEFLIGNTNFNWVLPYEYIFNDYIQTRNIGNHTVIHTFEQNSHDQNINSSLQESISKINTFIDWNSCLDEANNIFGKKFVKKYMNWNEIQIQNIYGKIWSRILSYDTQTKNEAIKILKNEIIEGYGKCLTGRINRIISSLCGIDNDIQQKISLSQQFTLIFDALRQKYSNIDIFSNQFIHLFKNECIERNIDKFEIDLYIESIQN